MLPISVSSDLTADPTKLVNYIIYPTAVDPQKGKSPEEIRKFTVRKVAAIAIKMFLAIVTGGLSLVISVMLQQERVCVEQIQKTEKKLGLHSYSDTAEGLLVAQNLFMEKTGKDLSKASEALIVWCAKVANISFIADDEKIISEALTDSIANPWKGGEFGPF